MAKSITSSEESVGRGHWGNQIEFILSIVGYSVGLGNIWRFPYLCMENGGGVFLIPYFFFLFLCGMPLFFMELSLGQFSSLSPVGVFNLCPVFKGVGWGMLTVSGILCIYYNIIMAWVIYYLGMSFSWELPWKSCNNTWNTPTCYSFSDSIGKNLSMSIPSLVTYEPETLSNTSFLEVNATGNIPRSRSSTEEFWLFNTLEKSDGIEFLGGFNYKLLVAFTSAWILTYVCLIRGIKSTGKVVYVTATAPYIFLTIILIRGLTLPGSSIGINYYISPKWERLLTFKIWSTAAMQIFYSLGPSWGGLITMASYNKFNHNILRDAIMCPVICCLTSFYGGFAIFSVIGHMAYVSGEPDINKVIQSGPGLAFVAYPEALAQLPGGAIWSALFFLMLVTVGLDSMFGTFETMISGFADEFPRIGRHRNIFTLTCVIVQFLIGLPLVTRAGIYIFQILDWYAAAFTAVVIGFLECIAVTYFYGIKRMFKNIESMMTTLNTCWKSWWMCWKVWWGICWCVLTPSCLLVVIVSTIIQYDEPVFDTTYRYPRWAIAMGWMISMCSIIPIPIVIIIEFVLKRRNLHMLIRANETWDSHTAKRITQSNDTLLEKSAITSIPLMAVNSEQMDVKKQPYA